LPNFGKVAKIGVLHLLNFDLQSHHQNPITVKYNLIWATKLGQDKNVLSKVAKLRAQSGHTAV